MIITEDRYLAHYGKKGMKWGVRSARAGGSSAGSSANRQLNKASRKKDRQKLDKQIDTARARVKSDKTWDARLGLSDRGSKSHTELKKAKSEFKTNKQKLGSREARKILNKAREKRYKDIETSQYAKSGKETAAVVIGAVGLVALSALSSR